MREWAHSKGIPYFLMGPGLLWLGIFFVLPMLFMLSVSLYQGSLDTTYEMTWHFKNFKVALTDYDTQFIRSFAYAGAATVLCLVIAYPLSYAIAFKAGKWRQVMLLCVIAPFFTTYLIRTYAWQTILSNDGAVVNAFQTVGILGDNGTLLKTPTAVIAGLTYNFLPFMVLPIYASLEQMDTRLIEAARDLYSNARTAFFKVTLPISMPGVIAGTLLTFIPAVGDYINAIFLGSPNQAMIGNVIQSLYLVTKDYPVAAALSFIMMVLITVAVAIYIKFAGEESLMGDDLEAVTAK